MKTQLFKGIAVSIFVAMTVSPLYAQTADQNQPAQQEAVGEEAGSGIGSALANVFYIPAKVAYAGLGLLTGGLGYVLSGGRADIANNIIYPAVRGNYVVTPSHLRVLSRFTSWARLRLSLINPLKLPRKSQRLLAEGPKQTPCFEDLINSRRVDTSVLALPSFSISRIAKDMLHFLLNST